MTIDEALETLKDTRARLYCAADGNPTIYADALKMAIKALEQTRWIPCSERLPEDLEAVNITWVNHEPEPYYHDIKDKKFIATGIHYRGQWYWYSTTCADYLGEYGSNDIDKVDDAIEVIAWMPLPEPYREIKHTCSECIIKDTDACTRGNTEADEVACEDFVGGESDAE